MLPTPDAFDLLDFIFEGDPGDRDGSRVAAMICLLSVAYPLASKSTGGCDSF